ncbi:phytochelatin synthase family protein [Yoonia sp.]|uniref:phytochelatin synthase family protein n=1 Tax=Yoonia sp. TaxID=2212373 RepID=UPI00391BB5CC
MRLLFTLSAALLAIPALAQDEDDYPKLGPDATVFTADTSYLRSAPAPDYWAFSAFVKPQFSSSACSIATVTAAINGIIGQPEWASETIMTQEELLDLTGNAEWAALSAEGGDGVAFHQLVDFTAEALLAVGLSSLMTYFKPTGADADNKARMIDMLTKNELSANDAIMVYFNQGVVTGDWDGPHVALIGAYDAANDKVLILEVDQHGYIPYWASTDVLLQAMVKPTSAEHGVLEGETGGFVMIDAAR